MSAPAGGPSVATAGVTAVGAAEVALLAALHAETIGVRGGPGEKWSAPFVARLLALPGTFAFVAPPASPVGFALCLPAGEAVDVAAIGVRVAARRAGIGRSLVYACATRAQANGAARLMLEVAADNAAAIAFYRALGFAEAGRRPHYYAATPSSAPRDALVLSKAL